MVRKSGVAITAIVVGLGTAVGFAPPASAEWLADLFVGTAITQSGDVDLRFDGVRETAESDFKTSVSVGGRVGYWFGPFGVNLDLDFFHPDFDPDRTAGEGVMIDTDLRTFAIGPNAMLRGQFLKDTAVPGGRLQPYLFAGPTLFVSTLDTDVWVDDTRLSDSDTSATLGVTAGAGVTYMFTPMIGAFAEYRFTHSSPEFEFNGVTIDPELNTHHLLAGVTFRF